MRFYCPIFFRVFLIALFAGLFAACAPQNGEISEPEEPEFVVTPVETVEPVETVDVETETTKTKPPIVEPEVVDREGEPDWEKRFQELYAGYAEEFTAPQVGQAVRVEMRNGNHQRGRIDLINDHELVLETGSGVVHLETEHLSEASAMRYLRSAYARKQAYDQGRKEYQAWRQANTEEIPVVATSESTQAVQTTPGTEDAPVQSDTSGEFPFEVEAGGRVPHVEAYIRQNAAFPDSLNLRAWWPVEPDERGGYKVRVRYTLKSAGNLGTSYEDMMFFMHRNGHIHQRAPVK
jgi:hypothetical protein